VVVGLKTNCCAMAAGKPITTMLASAVVSANFLTIAFRYFDPSGTADQMARDSREFARNRENRELLAGYTEAKSAMRGLPRRERRYLMRIQELARGVRGWLLCG
jgi:hypothetical protein